MTAGEARSPRERGVVRGSVVLAGGWGLVNLAISAVVMPAGFFRWVRVTYAFNTVVVPVALVVAAVASVSHDRRRGRRPVAAAVLLAVALALVGLRLWATHVEPRLLRVREVTLATHHLGVPVRVLHISDLQADRVGRFEERVFATIRSTEPDLVLFTGDLLQPWPPATTDSEMAKVEPLLRSLDPALGFFGVCGNTDRGRLCADGRREVGGLTLLRAEGVVVEGGGGRLAVYGLDQEDSHHGGSFPSSARAWLAGQRRAGAFTIVLGHAPDYALAAPTEVVDLALAGHTHGGQIRLPGLGPLLTLSAVPRDWARGFRRVGPMALNVSAGLGAEHAAGLPSIRLNCPPEMTLIELVPRPGTMAVNEP